MTSVDSTIWVGPGFTPNPWANDLIDTLLADSSGEDGLYRVYHPYPDDDANASYTNNEIPSLVGSLEGIESWQNDVDSRANREALCDQWIAAEHPVFRDGMERVRRGRKLRGGGVFDVVAVSRYGNIDVHGEGTAAHGGRLLFFAVD